MKGRIGKQRRRLLQKYRCKHCKYRTAYKADLNTHVIKCCKVKTYKCIVCCRRFKTKILLKLHVEVMHVKLKRKQAQECSRGGNLEPQLEVEHSNIHHDFDDEMKEFRCPSCQFRTENKYYLEAHIKAEHLKEVDYKCETSKYKTSNKKHFKTHIKSKHLGNFNYNCVICEYRTKNRAGLVGHLKVKHLAEFRYECKICDCRTNNELKFERHMKTSHLKEFNYDCQLCEYRTYDKKILENHVKEEHPKEFNCKCNLCKSGTNQKSHLENHINTMFLRHIRNKLKVHVKRETAQECSTSGYLEAQLEVEDSRIRPDLDVEIKEFRCSSYQFRTENNYLETHIKSEHLKEVDYKWDYSEPQLEVVDSKIHLDVEAETKRFRCPSCQFHTENKYYLRAHIKSKHLKEFDYNCAICEYRTNYKGCLTNHLKGEHLKEFHYECAMCAYRTNIKLNLEKHIKATHLEKLRSRYEICEYKTCGKTVLESRVKEERPKEFNCKCDFWESKTCWKSHLKNHIDTMFLSSIQEKLELQVE